MSASAGDIKAGKAVVTLSVSDDLARGLKAASDKLKTFGYGVAKIGAGFTAIGSGIAAPLYAMAKSFSQTGDDIEKMARRTGMAAEAISELKFAAGQSGTNIEAIEISIKKMQKTIFDASTGMSTAVDALNEIGLASKDLKGIRPERQFEMIADALASIQDPTRKAALSLELFGKSGTQIIPVIEDFRELRMEARALGIVLSTTDAKAAADLNDSFGRIDAIMTSITQTIGAALTPVLLELNAAVKNIGVRFKKFLGENRDVIKSIFLVGAAIGLLGNAIAAIGISLVGFGASLAIASAALTAIAPLFSLATVKAAILAAGFVSLGHIITTQTEIGARSVEWLGDVIEDLRDDAIDSFQAIGNALAIGDIAQAARVVWAALKMEFTKGVNVLSRLWQDFKVFYLRVGNDAFYGVVSILNGAVKTIETTWYGLTANLSDAWTNFTATIKSAWSVSQDAIAKGMLDLWKLWDKTFDAETAKAGIEAEGKARRKQIDEMKKAQLAATETEFADRVTQANKSKADTDTAIDTERLRNQAQLENEYQKALDASMNDLALAKADWIAATEKAKENRIQFERESPVLKKAQVPTMEDVESAKVSVAGSFSAAAASAIAQGANSDATRTMKATEASAETLKKIERKIGKQAIVS